MASIPYQGRGYHNVHIGDSSRAHLGDVYNYGFSSDERALNRILDSLSYPGMTDRKDAIAEAHEGTFDWTFLEGRTHYVPRRSIFESRQDSRHYTSAVRMSFRTWLRDESQGLFVFTGKPGSGKSTFMKSLASSSELAKLLTNWTSGCTLTRADHCFWITGRPMQKSLEGMLRSLLYSVLHSFVNTDLRENVEAAKHVCGRRWLSSNTQDSWSCNELKGMLTRLSTLPRIKSFFLIDALDECEPQDCLYDLADEVLRMSNLANLKICVSCRPWKVFTDRFARYWTLRLDQLTFRDMKTYVHSRLLTAEGEGDVQVGVQEGSIAAQEFVCQVATAAEGIFLWVKLVTDELCIEMRKGRSIETLDEILSHIPTNLDDYFQRLIFNRIGRSRQNVMDTAAALKLAMKIHAAEANAQDYWGLDGRAYPFSNSFINFWLLSNHHLEAGFSWENHQDIAQPPTERMFKQTANFLRESCNELLFLSPDTGDVKFLHRTVYDYLSDNRLFVRNTPDHFDNDDFIDELSKLRCICILRLKHESCLELADTLESMVRSGIPSFYPIPWVLVCDSLLTSQIRSICRCNGLGHLPGLGVVRHLMITGFDGFICGELERLPFLAICEGRNWTLARHDNLLESALQRDCVADMRGLQGMSLRTILQCGGDPNAFNNHGTVNDYLSAPFGRPLASESLREKLRWCHHTHWEAWLYLQLKSCIGTRDPSKATTQVEQPWTAASLASKRKSAEIIELLLHYGASPCCLVCIEEHDPRQSPGPCTKVGLEELLNHIAPADSIAKLQGLRQTCAERIRIYNLRRNQRRRAVRSLIISEQNLGTALPQSSNIERELANATQRLRTWFFEGLLHLYSSKPECCICQQKTHDTRPALAIWCIECGDFSCLCLPCSEKHPAVIPTLEQPCETFDSTGSRCTKGHTSVFVVGSGAKARDNDYDPGFSDEYYDILSARHGIDQAASVVKEWYAKHPIKLDMSFEEVLAEMHQEGQDGIVEQASRSS